jgi:putative salt-induced outer membrane protein YdiY
MPDVSPLLPRLAGLLASAFLTVLSPHPVLALPGAEGTVAVSGSPGPAEKRVVPAWGVKLGFSYLATSGNAEQSTLGFEGAANRSWSRWSIEGSASALNARKRERRAAESYSLLWRIKRKLHQKLQLTAGLRGERNRFAGVDLRTLGDVSLQASLHESPKWKLRALAGVSWMHEEARGPRSGGPARRPDEALGGLLQLAGEGAISAGAQWNGQVTLFPNFRNSDDLRAQMQIGLQAPLHRNLGLRCAYDLKYDRDPVPGFETTDATTTASLVLQLGER